MSCWGNDAEEVLKRTTKDIESAAPILKQLEDQLAAAGEDADKETPLRQKIDSLSNPEQWKKDGAEALKSLDAAATKDAEKRKPDKASSN